jgi:membrane protease subunit HflK
VDEEMTLDDIIRGIVNFIRNNPFVLLGIVLLIALALSLSTIVFQVDRDEEAIVLRFGQENRVVGPGLHWKLPSPIETKYIVNTQKVFTEEFGFRTARSATYNNEALILTGDLGVARVEWVVHYKKTYPKRYLFNVLKEREILREASFAAMRRVIGDWNVAKVITSARQEIASSVQSEMQTILDSYSSGMTIQKIAIQSSEPPAPVESAYKQVDSARQKKEELRNEALAEKERVQNEVDGKVEKMLLEAQGDSAAMLNRARGDARRFDKILTQYRRAPRVTEDRMFLETMEDVMKRSERVYVVDGNVKSLLPMLNLKESRQ